MALLYGISDRPFLQKLKRDKLSTAFPRAAVPGFAFLGLCLLVALDALEPSTGIVRPWQVLSWGLGWMS